MIDHLTLLYILTNMDEIIKESNNVEHGSSEGHFSLKNCSSKRKS
jgi:hypothetical protein